MVGVLQVSRRQERDGNVRGGGAASWRAFEGGQHAEGRELSGEHHLLGRRPSVTSRLTWVCHAMLCVPCYICLAMYAMLCVPCYVWYAVYDMLFIMLCYVMLWWCEQRCHGEELAQAWNCINEFKSLTKVSTSWITHELHGPSLECSSTSVLDRVALPFFCMAEYSVGSFGQPIIW